MYYFNNKVKSFQSSSYVNWILYRNNIDYEEFIPKNYPKFTKKIKIFEIEKIRYMRLKYLIHSLWKRYWYYQRDTQMYSRSCRRLASKIDQWIS